ncbi:MAG: hypothetical protein KDA21_08545 [Phycisphaerales bacterium]|nr:hypothetical protein [Phycisphaerales bacterium]
MNRTLAVLGIAAVGLAGVDPFSVGLSGGLVSDASAQCTVVPGQCCAGRPRLAAQGYAGFGDLVTAVTASPGVVGGAVLTLYDVTGISSAAGNTLYAAPSYSDPSWTGTNLGSVFGLTLDASGNMYVTTSSAYYFDFAGPGGWGAVYRIDGVTGAITTFATLPNSTGVGLGNIVYDCEFDQFFVTNFEDGNIYRLDNAGTILSTFDHGAADSGTPGFAPLGDRPWGVTVHDGRVYYGVWGEDYLRNGGSTDNEIWSIALDGAGDFVGTEQLEIVMPNRAAGYSNPVSDIRFSVTGTMLVAERGMRSDTDPTAHQARALEFECVGGMWAGGPGTFGVGSGGGDNSAGGIDADFGPAMSVFVTGDALQFTPNTIYGFVALPGTGGTVVDSPLVDYNGNLTLQDKNSIGDIAVNSRGCTCQVVEVKDIHCPTQPGGAFDVTFDITNQSGQTAEYLFLTPLGSAVALPNIINLVPPLADGDTRTINVNVSGASGGEDVCFSTTLLNGDFEECCSQEFCFTLPDCDCLQIIDSQIVCSPDGTGTFSYTFTVQNLLPTPAQYIFLVMPSGVTATPNFFDLTGSPIPPYGTATLNTTISGALPGTQVCFTMTIHDGLHGEPDEICCGQEICIDIPDCDDTFADKCDLTRIVPCCPETISGNAVLTICNYGTAPVSYNWTIDNLTPSGSCTYMLAAGDFFPSSGTVGPVAPGGCVNIPVTVSCERFGQDPIACANFGVTFTNLATGAATSCTGVVQASQPGTVKNLDPVPTDVTAQAAPVRLDFEFGMLPGESGNMDYLIVQVPRNPSDQPVVSLNGRAPGEAVTGSVFIEDGMKQVVSVNATYAGGEGERRFEDVIVYADLTGSGSATHPAVSESVHILPPAARNPDINGDGRVDFIDLNTLLAGWRKHNHPADIDNSGIVDFNDLAMLLDAWNR